MLVSIRIGFFLNFFTNCRRPRHPDAEFAFSLLYIFDCIGGVIISVLDSSVVGRVFESQFGETKDYTVGVCCFSASQVA